MQWWRPQVLSSNISGIQSHLCHSLAMGYWAGYFISLSSGLHICKIRMIVLHRGVVTIKEENTRVHMTCSVTGPGELSGSINVSQLMKSPSSWPYLTEILQEMEGKIHQVHRSHSQPHCQRLPPRLPSLHQIHTPVVHGVSSLTNRLWLLGGRTRGFSISRSPALPERAPVWWGWGLRWMGTDEVKAGHSVFMPLLCIREMMALELKMPVTRSVGCRLCLSKQTHTHIHMHAHTN